MKNLTTKTLIALFALFSLSAKAQQYNAPIYEFYGSITRNLKITFQPVAVMIKVDIDQAGKVSSMEVSDSAGPDFKTQFEAAKPKLNMEALNRYVALNKLKNKSFLIPYYVTNETDKNKPHNEPMLTRFNGKNLRNRATILTPIKATYSVTTTITTSSTKAL